MRTSEMQEAAQMVFLYIKTIRLGPASFRYLIDTREWRRLDNKVLFVQSNRTNYVYQFTFLVNFYNNLLGLSLRIIYEFLVVSIALLIL